MTYKPNPLRPFPKSVSPIAKTKKPLPPKKVTGEGAMFKAIWSKHKHISFIRDEQGKYINLGNDAYAWNFAHVLCKKDYPHFRLYDRNIVLLTQEQHYFWDQARHQIKDDPEWKPMFALEAELKEEYKKQFKGK